MKEIYKIIILIVLTVIQIFANIDRYKHICSSEDMVRRTDPKKILNIAKIFIVLLILEIIWLILLLTGIIS